MAITILLTLQLMVAYFLILYAGVGFIQDKRFFSSAPKESLEAIPEKKERFPGAHVIGWIIGIIAISMFLGAFVLGAWDGIKRIMISCIALPASWRCSTSWKSMTSSFSIGSCSATPISSPIFTRS